MKSRPSVGGSYLGWIHSIDKAEPNRPLGAGNGLPSGTTVTAWGPTSITLSNNATATVSGAAYTIKYPLFGEIVSGGGTSTLTITTPYQAQNVTGGVLRHMDCGVFASSCINMHDVEINAHGSAGLTSVGGNCDLFLYGVGSVDGIVSNADNSQFHNVKTGSNLAFAGVITYGSDGGNASGFFGSNFAGPKVSYLSNSILGESLHGCHFSFNVGNMYRDASRAYIEQYDPQAATYGDVRISCANIEIAPGGTVAATWGSAGLNLATGKVVKVSSMQVVAARKTGWTAPTGTALRTGFDTATATLTQVAQTLKALIDDLHGTAGHGLIGT